MKIRSLMGPLVLALIPGHAWAQSPPAATAPAPGAPAAVTTKAAPAAPADADTAATRKSARELGLKPRTQGGTELYCKSFPEIGSNVAIPHCYTKQQVAELQKRTQSNQTDVSALQRASLTEPPAIEPQSGRR